VPIASNRAGVFSKRVWLDARFPFGDSRGPKVFKFFVGGMIVIGGHHEIIMAAALWGKYDIFGFAIRSLDAVIRRDTLSQ